LARRPCDSIDYDYYAAPPGEDDELAEREPSFVQRFEHLGAKPGVVLLVIGDQLKLEVCLHWRYRSAES